MKQTYGQKVCRVMASNDNSTPTERVKNMCAELIDLLERLKNDEKSLTYDKSEAQLEATSGNKLRLLTKAQEEIEGGLEWALKGITE